MRIEQDDVFRPQVLALLEEHLRNMHEIAARVRVCLRREPASTARDRRLDGLAGGCVARRRGAEGTLAHSGRGEVDAHPSPPARTWRGPGAASSHPGGVAAAGLP